MAESKYCVNCLISWSLPTKIGSAGSLEFSLHHIQQFQMIRGAISIYRSQKKSTRIFGGFMECLWRSCLAQFISAKKEGIVRETSPQAYP
jgi:hypothetical protein